MVRVEETITVASIEEPIREKMFVTTNENGRLKMLPLLAQVEKHDDEVDLLTLSRLELHPLFRRSTARS